MASKRKITVVGTVLAVAALLTMAAAVPSLAAPGSVTTIALEDGSEVILHPDSSWSYKNATLAPDDNGDVYIPLKTNVLWLRSDYTYTFVKSQPPKSNRPKSYPQVNAVGSSTMPSLDVATKTAVNQVYDKAAAGMEKYVMSKDKKAKAYLLACVKDEVKENELEQAYVQTKAGWKADAKVAIPGYRVMRIIECLDTQLAPAEEETAAKEAEKEAAKKKK
ncbi:MAG: hypothetical protein LBB74_10685 [Chitinispirillales bacterium]|jgi:hypothetical protein|nr:hypothetical protein [Chitinispirillales bacterium]